MHGEVGYYRFFCYLGLFIFAMTILVMGNNFIMLYLGWEGVGLCSYLLIGFYFEKPAAREAAKKAFLVNRVGDFGFGLGIMLIFLAFHSVSYFGNPAINQPGVLDLAQQALRDPASHPFQIHALQWIPFLLMIGAFGKSAQFPLYVWLPDAMEGPTPVSALIHAATMVTAGVYMIARCGPLFVSNQAAMMTIAFIGAFTALFAASIALRQFDLKKVFAYSTISQLGYMFVGVGVLAPTAAVFHLVTHAFFKALLFLSSGVVMHAMLGHLDMRKMSGLRRVLPVTNILMLIGCAALAGFPFTAGFFSKDEIVARAMEINPVLWGVVLFTAFMTAYYTFRLYFQVFHGPLLVPSEPAEGHGHDAHDEHSESDPDEAAHASDSAAGRDHGARDHAHAGHGGGHDAHHNHEPLVMIVPLIVLALGALGAGYLNWPTNYLAQFLGKSPSFIDGYLVASARYSGEAVSVSPALWGQPSAEAPEPLFTLPMIIGGVVSILGISLAAWLHLFDRKLAETIALRLKPLTRLLEGKYWVDEIYQGGIVEPLRELGRAFFVIDQMVVDKLVEIVGYLPMIPGFVLKFSTQRGFLQGYAAAMLLGIAAILVLIFVKF
jgi:NADH-quinone oxidoreductase subunit L